MGYVRPDNREAVGQKLARLLPGAEIQTFDEAWPVIVDVPGCDGIWIAVDVGPNGVNSVSLATHL